MSDNTGRTKALRDLTLQIVKDDNYVEGDAEVVANIIKDVLHLRGQKDWVEQIAATAKKVATLNMSADTRLAILDLIGVALLGENAKELLAKHVEKQTKKRPPKVPFALNPFDGTSATAGKAPAPNNPHSAHTLRAIIAGGRTEARKTVGWCENTANGSPIYREHLSSWGDGSMSTYFEPAKYNAPELWAKVQAMDAITLDVYLSAMSLICDPRNNARAPDYGWVTIHPEQILQFKSFTRHGNDKRITTQRILEAVKTLSELSTDIRNVPFKWEKRGKVVTENVTERGCKIFHIGSVLYHEQGELLEHKGGYPEEEKEVVAIHIIAGRWAKHWLNTVKDGQHYEWTSLASQVLLQFGNTGAEYAAKRFGALLLTMPGATGPFKATQTATHAEVLESIGELVTEDFRGKIEGESRQGQNWGWRMRCLLYGGENGRGNDVEGMFPLLVTAGLLESFEKPVDDLDGEDRGRGWVDRWLAQKVSWTSSVAAATLKAAELEAAQKAATAKRLGTAKKPPRPRGTGKTKKALVCNQYFDQPTINALYAAYRGRGWTQAMLARELGCARPTLSNILNRREAPSVELAAKIRTFLATPEPDYH